MATAFAAWLAVAKLAAWLAAFSTDTLAGSTAAVDSVAASDETAVDSAVAEVAGLTRASDWIAAVDWLVATEALDTCEVASFKAASLFEVTSDLTVFSSTLLDRSSAEVEDAVDAALETALLSATVATVEFFSMADSESESFAPESSPESGTEVVFSVEVLEESVLANVSAETTFPPKNMKAATATEATPTLNLRTEYRSRFSALARFNLRLAFLSMNISPF